MSKKNVDSCLTPIWDEPSGQRLATIRMMHLLDQSELAERLGVSQSIICRIEQGRLRVPEKPFSLEALKAIFPTFVSYILLNSGEEKVNRNFYVEKYWRHKLKHKPKLEKAS